MENENKNETLLSVPAAAKYLGVSVATLWRRLDTRTKQISIGYYRIGNRVLLSKEKHLDVYLAACEVKPVEVPAILNNYLTK